MFKFIHGFSFARPLPTKLRKNDCDYTLVTRNEKVAIYMQWYTENIKYYEVFKIKIKPASKFKGKDFPRREVFPSNEDFGKTAWSCRTLERAKVKFDELTLKFMNESKQ